MEYLCFGSGGLGFFFGSSSLRRLGSRTFRDFKLTLIEAVDGALKGFFIPVFALDHGDQALVRLLVGDELFGVFALLDVFVRQYAGALGCGDAQRIAVVFTVLGKIVNGRNNHICSRFLPFGESTEIL